MKSADMMLTWPSKSLINPIDPQAERVQIEDIAHSLGMQCRYGGHVPRFYSVAEHSVYVSAALLVAYQSKRLALAGLLHDASETYLQDLIRPTKNQMPEYKVIENRVQGTIDRKFQDDREGFMPIVADYDCRLLKVEMIEFYGRELVGEYFPHILGFGDLPERVEFGYWEPVEARMRFLLAYDYYLSA